MLPLFPSNLDPTILSGSIINGLNSSSNNTSEENEISELEQEHTKYLQELEKIVSDIPPLGKLNSVQNNEESDSEEGSNEESDSEDDESNVSNEAEVTVNY